MPKARIFSLSIGTGPDPKITETDSEFIVRGVSVMTVGPAEGHEIEVELDGKTITLQEAVDETTIDGIIAKAAQFETGVKVKADHRSGIKDVIGYLTGFSKDASAKPVKCRADFHIFKTVPDLPHLLTLIKTLPDALGFSAFFEGPVQRLGQFLLMRVSELFSVDFVTDPAANPSGIFSVEVDSRRKPVPGNNPKGKTMTPDEISQLANACTEQMKPHIAAAIAPHLESINTRLAAVEARGVPTATTAAPAAGGPAADEESLYSRFADRILKDAKITSAFEKVVTTQMQETAKVIHALGLAPGTGPGTSAPVNPNPPKKVEDMTFEEIIEVEFSKTENQSKRDHEIIRDIVKQFPEKHRTAMGRRDAKGRAIGIEKLPVRKVPFKAA